MLSTNKNAKLAIRQHILDCLSEYKSVEDIKSQMECLFCRYDQICTYYNAGKQMAQDGYFLIYHYDVCKWLLKNNLTTKNHLEKFDDCDSWEYYKHLIARELQHVEKWHSSLS